MTDKENFEYEAVRLGRFVVNMAIFINYPNKIHFNVIEDESGMNLNAVVKAEHNLEAGDNLTLVLPSHDNPDPIEPTIRIAHAMLLMKANYHQQGMIIEAQESIALKWAVNAIVTAIG